MMKNSLISVAVLVCMATALPVLAMDQGNAGMGGGNNPADNFIRRVAPGAFVPAGVQPRKKHKGLNFYAKKEQQERREIEAYEKKMALWVGAKWIHDLDAFQNHDDQGGKNPYPTGLPQDAKMKVFYCITSKPDATGAYSNNS